MPAHSHSPQTIKSHFGRFDLDRSICKLLERLRLHITGRAIDETRGVMLFDMAPRQHVSSSASDFVRTLLLDRI